MVNCLVYSKTKAACFALALSLLSEKLKEKLFEKGVLKMNSGDTAWVLMSTALVLLMTIPGLAFFYGGLVRRKNVLSILMQCFIILCVISLQWVLFGYSLAFGPDFHGIIGNLNWAGLRGVGPLPNPDYAATIPHSVFMVFQMMFAVITPALIIGAYAERVKFPAFLLFTILWATFVYDPLAHWVWGTGGWLKNLGALDFAGGIVVHVSSGISALVLAIMLGRRIGYNHKPIRPHNLPFTVLGGALLWFGWFGFNAGSALAANGIAAQAFVNTAIAGSIAMCTWLGITWWKDGKPSLVGALTGAVAGLACISPCAGYIPTWAAFVVGLTAGALCYFAVVFKDMMKWDDALDVWACHGVGGVLGTILLGVFALKSVNPNGADGLIAGNWTFFGWQVLATVIVASYAFVATFLILKIINT